MKIIVPHIARDLARLGLSCGLVMVLMAGAPSQQETRKLPPGPLLWAYGADDYASIPLAKRMGLNVVMLELKAPLETLERGRAIATCRAARDYGMKVIVGLPLTLSEQFSTSLSNPLYVKAVTDYVKQVVADLRNEPNVIGWATGDYLEKYLHLSDADFRQYLMEKYGSMEQVAKTWKVPLTTATAATLENTPTLDDELPFGVGLPSLDLAEFQAAKYQEMMEFWAALVREATGGKGLLFTGRVTLYRSLVSIPAEYDVIVVSMPPHLLEPDWDTHNVQALDIARGPSCRPVIPCLRLPSLIQRPELYAKEWIREWMMEAAMHGAVGLSFEAPPEVLANEGVRKEWVAGLAWMEGQAVWGLRPRGVGAILYEPYAEGFSALTVPVYGYLADMSNREPTDLFHAFKWGTRYGSMVCLQAADVAREDLNGYSVILAPMALNLPESLQMRLTEYVAQGGVLVADIGAGMRQSGSWNVLPPRLAELFGVGEFVELRNMTGNLTIHQPHPVVPSLPGGARTRGDFASKSSGRRVGSGRFTVSGWTGFTLVPEGATPFARLAMSITEEKKPTFAGIIARDTGKGTTLFATHRLWSNWLPEDPLFQPFHADLWQRRARVELLDAPFCMPAVEISEGQDGRVVLYNREANKRVQIALYAAEHRLFTGAVCQFSAQLIDESGLRTGAVLATLDVPRHSSWALLPTSIEVRPYTGTATAYVEEYTPQLIRLTLGGNGAQPIGPLRRLQISKGQPQRVRLTMTSDLYPLKPGSHHRLTVTEQGRKSEQLLKVDEKGRLLIEATVGLAQLEICPAS
ncbi:MAG: beta-galactosidase trimerization domain-containing protein [Candidatus Zipacnadales bacterium]